MRIQTFSIVVGTRACNAKCPFCVSRMTGFDILPSSRGVNERNLKKAVAAAKLGGTTTLLFTGKGEPTLYPDEMTRYLELVGHDFPFLELQTNALEIGRLAGDGQSRIPNMTRDTLLRWHDLGLDTIAVSVVDIEAENNAKVYHKDYPELTQTLSYIHDLGFSIRLCVMMQNSMVDTPERLSQVIDFCRDRGVEQLTVRPIRQPDALSDSEDASGYVTKYGLSNERIIALQEWVEAHGTQLLTLLHGARVYDIDGQNLCFSDCLTVDAESDDIRTLIYYGDGRIAYDWQYDGAVLIGAPEKSSLSTTDSSPFKVRSSS